MMNYAHPILSCRQSISHESGLLMGQEKKEWVAMCAVGRELGWSLLRDYQEIGAPPEPLKVLILAGKGHNAGDALLAAGEILSSHENTTVFVIFVYGRHQLKPLVGRAFEQLLEKGGERVEYFAWSDRGEAAMLEEQWNMCIDGIVGMQFAPPFRPPGDEVISWINAHRKIDFRAAVDLPSGLSDASGEDVFRTDFTYATGIAKTPLFEKANQQLVGRVRYIDIGFFASGEGVDPQTENILLPSVLDPIRGLRRSQTDKRSFGHLFIIAGSRSMPGAALMAAQAAVRSGVGLVTAFVPQSVCGYFSAALPEAMWVPWPETTDGGLAMEGYDLLRSRIKRATGVLAGPGMGDGEETQALLARMTGEIMLPTVLDADALREGVVSVPREAGAGRLIVTPHFGEFTRMNIEGGSDFGVDEIRSFSRRMGVITVLKGPVTRITDGTEVMLSTFGGPLLARGGSGDVLSGLVGGRVAAPGAVPLEAAYQGVAWHGLAADSLARRRGAVAVKATDLLDELNSVLRDE
jgi:hydroxyethylthiazole kinase-like uncharacterized protein yjeF